MKFLNWNNSHYIDIIKLLYLFYIFAIYFIISVILNKNNDFVLL